MHQITVKKDDLIKIVEENRENHRGIYDKAVEAYHKTQQKWLDENIKKLKAGKEIVLYFGFPTPEDHTKDYDRVLRMLELSIDTEVTLSEADVSMYVQDDWQWKNAWTTTNSAYGL